MKPRKKTLNYMLTENWKNGFKVTYIFILFSLLPSCNKNEIVEYPEILNTILEQYPMYVNISPDGNKILLKSRGKENFELLISNVDSIKLDTIDKSEFSQLSLTWHPNNKEIFFQEFNFKTRKYHLYKTDLNTRKRTPIELPTSNNAVPPLRFSKNGRYLAYLSSQATANLLIYNLKEKKIINRFEIFNPYSDFHWKGDSTIFLTKTPKSSTLYKVNINTNKRKLYSLLEQGEVQRFSIKDNNILLVGRAQDEEYFQRYEFNLMTQSLVKLTNTRFNVTNCKYSKNNSFYYYNQNEEGMDRVYSSDSLINNFIGNNYTGAIKIDSEYEDNLIIRHHSLNSPPKLDRLDISNYKKELVYAPKMNQKLRVDEPKFLTIKRPHSFFEIPSYFWKATSLTNSPKTIIYIHGGPYGQIKPLWDIRTKLLTYHGFNLLDLSLVCQNQKDAQLLRAKEWYY